MPTIARRGLREFAKNATLQAMRVFEPLAAWQRLSRKSDRQLADLIGVSHSKISRAKRGLHMLPLRDQIALERITGITPAEWTAFYSELLSEGTEAPKGKPQKKSLVGGPAAEPEAV